MGIKLTKLPEFSPEDLTDSESHLWFLLREREECIQELKDEIARLKGEKGKPKIKPSRLEPTEKAQKEESDAEAQLDEKNPEKKKRPGSDKRDKTADLPIHETKVIQPTEEIPIGSEFRGYQDYTVQELSVRPQNTLYRLAIWQTPTGEYLRGKLPKSIRETGHFGVILRSYLLYQYHHCHVTQPKLLKQMNEWFAWFETTPHKNRLNFLELLRGERTDYVLSSEALTYMAEHKLPRHFWSQLGLCLNRAFKDNCEWLAYLKGLGIFKPSHIKTATEGALLGALIASGVSPHLGIISDGAGQFRLLEHGLCWVHAERLINKLIPFTEAQRQAVESVQDEIWDFYQNLKNYKTLSAEEQQTQKIVLEASFDQIFTQTTSFETLNQVLRRLNGRKAELLKVLDRPELPLHNNASEQDIREFVTKRKISGSTRSEEGRRCRDTFASLKNTCRKLGVSFWEYLTDRVSGQNLIPTLGELIAQKALGSRGTLAPDGLSVFVLTFRGERTPAF